MRCSRAVTRGVEQQHKRLAQLTKGLQLQMKRDDGRVEACRVGLIAHLHCLPDAI